LGEVNLRVISLGVRARVRIRERVLRVRGLGYLLLKTLEQLILFFRSHGLRFKEGDSRGRKETNT
jgi:hypothetical protein